MMGNGHSSKAPPSKNPGAKGGQRALQETAAKDPHCGQGVVVYADGYNIDVPGVQYLHSFDSQKWGKVYRQLVKRRVLTPQMVARPQEATYEELRRVHTDRYLQSLNSSATVAGIIEVSLAAFIPAATIDAYVLRPMRLQTGGTALAAELALQHRVAINIGGGFHHASGDRGGGFCVYTDITLALRNLLDSGRIRSALIVDLDAHQGNGHARDFAGDDRVKIFDMYNAEIYPQDHEAR
ncbi:Protein HDA-11, partial [Aphelenchoides avenae]